MSINWHSMYFKTIVIKLQILRFKDQKTCTKKAENLIR